MALQFHNTLTRTLEPFEPITSGKADMYTCGPTVYNYAHIGNFRAYIFEDILRRVLKYCGYDVTQIMNLTDVDDKTIRDSQANGMGLNEFTATYKKAFFDDLEELNIEPAEVYPAATDHVQEMIDIIKVLEEKGFAYVGDDGSVYYSIAKFENYGRLGRVDLENQRSGVRINTDEYEKEQAADFALWKKYEQRDGDVAWDSPWGKGRPGWHIECSAMSTKYLGNHFDLHTGGVDNIFPHHDDEIAQTEAATGEKFVNYWLHCEHLMVNNRKMSKSEGNFFTLRQLLDKGFSGREVRWLLMNGHYRQKLNFTYTAGPDKTVAKFNGLESGRSSLKRLDEFIRRIKTIDATDGEDVKERSSEGAGRDVVASRNRRLTAVEPTATVVHGSRSRPRSTRKETRRPIDPAARTWPAPSTSARTNGGLARLACPA
jgi:cysteinyl-tRNA synthetase